MSTQRFEHSVRQRFFSPTMIATPPELITHLVLGLDVDGCTDRILARSKLADDIAHFVLEHPELESIDYIISSLRQNFILDYRNAVNNPLDEMGRTQSCTVLSEGFLNDVQMKIQTLFAEKNIQRPIPSIRFHPVLLGDILNHFSDGASLDKMADFHHYSHYPDADDPYVTIQNRLNEDVSVAYFDKYMQSFESASEFDAEHPANDFYDTSKIVLIWFQMQYFAHVFGKDKPFTFRFVDDNLDIIAGITQYFRKNRYLIPANCSLEYMYMSSNFHHYPPEYKAGKPIKGVGQIYDAYRDMVADIARTVSASCAETDEDQKTRKIKELFGSLNPTKDECSSYDELDTHVQTTAPANVSSNQPDTRLSIPPQLQLLRPVPRRPNSHPGLPVFTSGL